MIEQIKEFYLERNQKASSFDVWVDNYVLPNGHSLVIMLWSHSGSPTLCPRIADKTHVCSAG